MNTLLPGTQGITQEERKVKPHNPNTLELMKQLSQLTGRPFETDTKPEPLASMVNQLDDVHAELPALLREPGISDADYDQMWDAHKHISKALVIMVRVQRRGETK